MKQASGNSSRFRENAPLYGVLAIVLLAFAALVLFGEPQRVRSPDTAAAPPIETLPAIDADARPEKSDIAAGDAEALNASVPFDENPDAAKPFVFAGNGIDRTRARDCLALAAMAEAGSGDPDQRAVMQVVLNRVRHPAFKNTVCGVVFEGSQRRTGCQFTFTCDGSLARTYSDAMWSASRRRAEEALGGRVDTNVGNATHYHADYVYPSWSPKLAKIAKVGPHIFFRWRGFWGTPGAMSARYRGGEPDPDPLREQATELDDLRTAPSLAVSGEAVRSVVAAPKAGAAPGSPAPGVHFVVVSPADAPQALIDKARTLCPGSGFCQVYGWSDPAAIPADLPVKGAARSALRFSFLPARNGNSEVVYFDCRTFSDPGTGTCLPQTKP